MSTFVHLHVASGYSMQYGASTPAALVARAAAFGQPALALTDRDGLYGAVRFVQACTEAKIAPILGVDLAVHLPPSDPATGRYAARPGSFSSASSVSSTGSASASTSSTAPPVWARPSAPVRTPVRGGAIVDPRLPRVTVLARGLAGGVAPGLGWARLCRLVTRTHLSGERGNPLTTPQVLAELAAPVGDDPAALIVLLGPDSDVGRAVLAKRRAAAYQALERWRAVLPAGALALETVCHGGPEGTPASLGHAARMLALGRDLGVPVILSAQVRHADPAEAATVDVLDAARRLVALDVRHLDRVTTAGHLAPTPAMYAVACDIVQASGPGLAGAGMDGEPGGLVEHDEVVIAVEHAELARFRLHPGLATRRRIPGDLLAGAQEVPGLRLRDAVERQVPGANPLLNLVARQVEMNGEGAIEADPRLIGSDTPGAGVHGRRRKESKRISTSPIEIALSATLKSGQR